MSNYEFFAEQLRELTQEARTLRPAPLVNGDDLIAMGLRPGPLFREILERVEEAQLDGTLTSREQALAFVRERWAACGA